MNINDFILAGKLTGSGGGGGGGSSDFHSAEVTLAMQGEGYIEIYNSQDENYRDTSIYVYDDGTFKNGITIDTTDSSKTATLIWVNGNSVTLMEAYGARVSESGDVSYDSETNQYTIWGDCTITMSSID